MGIVQSFDGSGNESIRQLFLEGWSGCQSHTNDTVGAVTRRAESVALTLIGSTQPEKLSLMLRKSDDGFIERFSGAINFRRSPYRDNEDDVIPNVECLELIDKIFFPIVEIDTMRECQFSDAARLIFKAWRKANEEKIQTKGISAKFRGHLSKYETLFCGLCVVFNTIEFLVNIRL